MLSSNLSLGILAFALVAVNAGPCRPTIATTTVETTSTATDSSVDVFSTVTETLSISTDVSSLASTDLTDVSTFVTLTSSDSDSTSTDITTATVTKSTDDTATSAAASTTTSVVITPPGEPTYCSHDDDCLANTDLCLLGGSNLCVCVDAVCALQSVECSTNQDCIAALGAGALGLYACVDLVCQQTA